MAEKGMERQKHTDDVRTQWALETQRVCRLQALDLPVRLDRLNRPQRSVTRCGRCTTELPFDWAQCPHCHSQDNSPRLPLSHRLAPKFRAAHLGLSAGFNEILSEAFMQHEEGTARCWSCLCPCDVRSERCSHCGDYAEELPFHEKVEAYLCRTYLPESDAIMSWWKTRSSSFQPSETLKKYLRELGRTPLDYHEIEYPDPGSPRGVTPPRHRQTSSPGQIFWRDVRIPHEVTPQQAANLHVHSIRYGASQSPFSSGARSTPAPEASRLPSPFATIEGLQWVQSVPKYECERSATVVINLPAQSIFKPRTWVEELLADKLPDAWHFLRNMEASFDRPYIPGRRVHRSRRPAPVVLAEGS
jgi:hypothetical protein